MSDLLSAEGPPSDDLIPGVELGKPLGEGAFGEVFEGIQLDVGLRKVAVKLLRKDELNESRKVRFIEETRLLALLDHPHIARLHGSGQTQDGRPYYLMEMLEGPTFEHWLTGADYAARLEILAQIAEAVAYAHRKGIVHRDLKPSNILIVTNNERAQAKVIDFGIARALLGPESWCRESTLEGQRLGTPLYMAPEQLAGEPGIDLRTDIFAVGLLLYESQLKKPVLDAVVQKEKSWEAMLKDLRAFTFPKLARRELDWIARKACALDVNDRYQSAESLAADLRNLQSGRFVSAGAPHWTYRTRKFIAAHRLAFALSALALLALLTLTIASWRVSRIERQARLLVQEAQDSLRLRSSDSSLLAASRAMDNGDYAEANRLLDQSLKLNAENQEAHYARNFLRATVPLATPLPDLTLPAPGEPIGLDEAGHFCLRLQDGSTHLLDRDGNLLPFDGQITKPSGDLQDASGLIMAKHEVGSSFRFLDQKTSAPALAPLIYGSGRERAIYSAKREQVLVTGTEQKATLWDVSAMKRAYEEARFDPPIVWMGFERKANTLWTVDHAKKCRKWPEGRKPGFGMTLPFFQTGEEDADNWKLGEGHTRGLSDGKQSFIGLVQLTAWNVFSGGSTLNSFVQARDRDCHLAGGQDAKNRLAFQKEETAFQAIEGAKGTPLLLAIEARGQIGLAINDHQELEIIDLANLRVTHRQSLPAPVVSATILDGGQDLIVAYETGEVQIFEPDGSPRAAPLALAGQKPPFDGLQVRAVPGKREFFLRLAHDLLLYRYSALTFQPSAPPLRHQAGIDWICPSADGSFLFSLDQNPQSTIGTLRIWSLRTHQEIAPPLQHPARILFATVLDNGRRIATSDAKGSLRRWIFQDESDF